MKKIFNKKTYFILIFSAVFLPYQTFASTIYIDTNHSDFFVGDNIVFNIKINSENKSVNAIEGALLIDYPADSVSLVDISTSGSKFSLWPEKPFPSQDNKNISFTGGIPGGFNSKDATVFSIILKLKEAGQITLIPQNIAIYLNDGKGTKDKVSVKNFIINILPSRSDSRPIDNQNNLISEDKTPPEPFEIYLGQEGSVFDGKKFLSFITIDKQSGVAYYEIIEGSLPPVRSNGTYILQEQNKSVKVVAIAYDSAGNARKSVYNQTSYTISYPIIIIFVMLIFIYIIYKKSYLKKQVG